MPYKEPPNVKDIERKYSFAEIEWLDPESFKLKENSNTIHPFILSADGHKIYIGKTARNSGNYYDDNVGDVEVIGAVMKNLNNVWELNVPYSGTISVVTDNFVVLNLSDPDSYCWELSENGHIPRHALRGAADHAAREFLYIGRTTTDGAKVSVAEYYDWRDGFLPLGDPVIPMIGKVHPSHHSLYAPLFNREVACSTYETLCLKPSPASLKILSRIVLRKHLAMTNETITKLKTFLPEKLVKFIDYPTHMYYGEYMLKNEILNTANMYHVYIDDESKRFVCKSNADNSITNLNNENAHSLYLDFNRIILCFANSDRFKIYATIDNNHLKPNEYKLSLSIDSLSNNTGLYIDALVEIFNSDQNSSEVKSYRIFETYRHCNLNRFFEAQNYVENYGGEDDNDDYETDNTDEDTNEENDDQE